MILPDPTYDWLKWFTLIFLPALAVFLNGLGEIYENVNMTQYVQIVNLSAAFIGALLQLSAYRYQQHHRPDLSIQPHIEETPIISEGALTDEDIVLSRYQLRE